MSPAHGLHIPHELSTYPSLTDYARIANVGILREFAMGYVLSSHYGFPCSFRKTQNYLFLASRAGSFLLFWQAG